MKLKYPIYYSVFVYGTPLVGNFTRQARTRAEEMNASETKSKKTAIRHAKKFNGAMVVAYWLQDGNIAWGEQIVFSNPRHEFQKWSPWYCRKFDNEPLSNFIEV